MIPLLLLMFVNPVLTPGAVRPLTLATICATKWGTDSRHVSASLKARVFVEYGIPLADRHLYVVDHKIPREIAGSDSILNLWPELIGPAHAKDKIENELHRAICAPNPTITLDAAQQRMRAWAGQ